MLLDNFLEAGGDVRRLERLFLGFFSAFAPADLAGAFAFFAAGFFADAFLGARFFAAAFLAGFFAAGFFGDAFPAAGFFAARFLGAGFFDAFFAAGFFADAFFPTDFFAAGFFFAGPFGAFAVPFFRAVFFELFVAIHRSPVRYDSHDKALSQRILAPYGPNRPRQGTGAARKISICEGYGLNTRQ